ncbi:MAG: DUF1832 domain-containing protein [Desulfobacteraceae bacterium]|nr:MAG: DUF1832 domain-containing protein [Desulfobacteraceae bacterium]
MSDIYVSIEDENFIESALRHGFKNQNLPKWAILRIALAKSLSMNSMPDESFDTWEGRLKNYDLEQVTWKGQKPDERGVRDSTDAVCTLLSVYHDENFFEDEEHFRKILQRHIRRGLNEMRASWRPGHDFYDYLYHELFSSMSYFQAKEDAPDFSNKLLTALKEIGVTAKIHEEKRGPRISRYFLYIENAEHLERIQKGLNKLCFLLGYAENTLMIRTTSTPRLASLDIPRPRNTWDIIPAALMRTWVSDTTFEMEALTVWPGVDILGNPYNFSLAHAPHLLIGGTTGSGKSVCVHALLISLLLQFKPENLQICLIDTKRVEFAPYKGLPHLYENNVITNAFNACEILSKLVQEMESRIQKLEQIKAANLSEASKQKGFEIPRIVVFVEELADLILQSDHEAEKHLVRLAQLARVVGIHLVLATQRPDAETFTGLLRSNIPARIALTVQKGSESKIILDQTGAEKLLKEGDMLVKIDPGSDPVRVHGVYISHPDIKAYIREINKERYK